ncbi:hypothetical protein [Dactylosporangium matsuzakiense]|uniref:Uncharacterized protein n=1 Tax=Dactylosporangium matsuzakiense TaxID=53360 RepID=A0A9W6NLF5_9ACTN|nr:hypothetical protein [Dactylosporangium matsuzakiense]UWZ48792.1 hypothetical protein Dmats_21750 [Dactylosporangium matsuzakiense]GLL01106.1 hypothetical protein GCM10017581_028470 [Dactylosporangium matsuzakiense]
MTNIVLPGSVLAGTAAELVERHRAEPGGDGTCQACGWPAPCPAAQHAGLVLASTPAARSGATGPVAPPLRAAA